MPDNGQTHITRVVQLSNMRGGDKARWQLKLITAAAVDTLFVRGLSRTHRVLLHSDSNAAGSNLYLRRY
eukprot:5065562-Pleurochrysis_carterae.AAC.1